MNARFLLHYPVRDGSNRRSIHRIFEKGRIASLAGGAGTGLLIVLAGFISLKAFEKKKKTSSLATLLQTVGSNGQKGSLMSLQVPSHLSWDNGYFLQTQKLMPAGLVAGISALTTCFYVYKIATGGNHIPPKAE